MGGGTSPQLLCSLHFSQYSVQLDTVIACRVILYKEGRHKAQTSVPCNDMSRYLTLHHRDRKETVTKILHYSLNPDISMGDLQEIC